MTKLRFSELVKLALELYQLNSLLVDPSIVIPAPSAVMSVGLATLANSIFLSATVRVTLDTVLVDPITVRLPLTNKLFPILADPAIDSDCPALIDPERSIFPGA